MLLVDGLYRASVRQRHGLAWVEHEVSGVGLDSANGP
jgi:hypothetical protein